MPAGSPDSIPDPMARAIELAKEVRGRVAPTHRRRRGRKRRWYRQQGKRPATGGPHAEVVAIASAGASARGASLFVTLEPCSHFGRTPPCADAIIAAGIATVVCGRTDPDPRVQGRGIERLLQAGVGVRTGDHEAEISALLAGYIKHRATGLPLVTAKFAMSLDGKIGTRTGDSRWVSGPATLAWAHEERTHIDAIAVGVNTVLVDNPQLTARPQGIEDRINHFGS